MKWQNHTIVAANSYELRKELNTLGEKGWEAISVVRIDYTKGNAHPSTFKRKILPKEVFIAYLKRPKK